MGWVQGTGGRESSALGWLAGGCHHPGLKAREKSSRTAQELVQEGETPLGSVAVGPAGREGAGGIHTLTSLSSSLAASLGCFLLV